MTFLVVLRLLLVMQLSVSWFHTKASSISIWSVSPPFVYCLVSRGLHHSVLHTWPTMLICKPGLVSWQHLCLQCLLKTCFPNWNVWNQWQQLELPPHAYLHNVVWSGEGCGVLDRASPIWRRGGYFSAPSDYWSLEIHTFWTWISNLSIIFILKSLFTTRLDKHMSEH